MPEKITREVTRMELDAVDPKQGMTLEELADFVQTAYRLDMDPKALVHVKIGFRSQIQSLKVPR